MSKPAYTLIELLIIVAITGILITLGTSAYGSAARRQSVKAAAESILNVIQTAQKNALIGDKTCSDAFLGYEVKYTDSSPTLEVTDLCETAGTGTTVITVIDQVNFVGSGTILFRPLGEGVNFSSGGDSLNLTFAHQDTGESYQILLDRTGTIKYLGAL